MSGRVRIAFLVLAHGAVQPLAELVRSLVKAGDLAVVHYDKNCDDEAFDALRESLAGVDGVQFATRVRCGWGEFSLVEATLNMLRGLAASGEGFDYAYLVSGADLPIRPLADLKRFLAARRGQEFIQSKPLNEGQWVIGGLNGERFLYRFPFNERQHPRFFYGYLKLQQRLRWRRRVPAGLTLSLGSQWWCLSREAVLGILDLVARRKELIPYFRQVWIPDESFFQTLARDVVDPSAMRNTSLTLFEFSDYGKPIVFFDRHYDYLARKPFFFARKFAPSALELRRRLLDRFHQDDGASGADIDPLNDRLHHRPFVIPFRDRHRATRHPGLLDNEWFGGLQFNATPIHLVLSDFTEMQGLREELECALPGVAWMGRLFGPGEVDFGKDRDVFAGYSRSSTSARDHAPLRFLDNVVAAAPAGLGLLMHYRDNDWVRDVLLALPRTKVLLWAKKPGREFAPQPDLDAIDVVNLAPLLRAVEGDRPVADFDHVIGAVVGRYLADHPGADAAAASDRAALRRNVVLQAGEPWPDTAPVAPASARTKSGGAAALMRQALLAHIERIKRAHLAPRTEGALRPRAALLAPNTEASPAGRRQRLSRSDR